MPFVKAYSEIKKCTVAIVKTFYGDEGRDKPFPEIFGTGFFCSQAGIVCTCNHVADAITALPKPPDFQGYPAQILAFVEMEHEGNLGVAFLNIDIEQIGGASVIGNTEIYLGPNPPDMAFLLASVTETPSVRFAIEPLQEGEQVAFAGFPMGTRTLTAPGWLQQFSPTLHGGLVSVILPHHTSKMPHGFLVHANTQDGASGSPVFRETGEVVGMVHSGYDEFKEIEGKNGHLVYRVPTSLTGCIPSHVMTTVLGIAESDEVIKRLRPTYKEYLASRETKLWKPGTRPMTKWESSS